MWIAVYACTTMKLIVLVFSFTFALSNANYFRWYTDIYWCYEKNHDIGINNHFVEKLINSVFILYEEVFPYKISRVNEFSYMCNLKISIEEKVHKDELNNRKCIFEKDSVGHAFFPIDDKTAIHVNKNFLKQYIPLENHRYMLVDFFGHEIGHALGLKHIDHDLDIMYPFLKNSVLLNKIYKSIVSMEKIISKNNLIDLQYLYSDKLVLVDSQWIFNTKNSKYIYIGDQHECSKWIINFQMWIHVC